VAGVLSKIIGLLLLLVCLVIFITLLGLDFTAFIAPIGTAVLAISFVFGSMASNAFKSFVFLFFVNPFDVGDRVGISAYRLVASKIDHFVILSTLFLQMGRR
jgi:small-conductance mechanosensitive channel